MLYKGLVVKIKKEYAIVLTDEEKFLKIKLKNNLKIGNKILFTEDDILQKTINSTDWKERINMSKKIVAIAASLVLLITVGIIGYNVLIPEDNTNDENQPVLSMLSDEATSVISIDINPSIELFLDENNIVIDIQSLNEDAGTLDLTQFVGLSAEDAVEGIVALAVEAGFINQEDLTEDYVLLTVADINEDDVDDISELETRLRERILASGELQSLNVAILKATRAEIFEAEGKDVPFGLYVINGMIESDGEYITIKEFFENPENEAAFLKKGNIVEMTLEKKIQQAEKIMNKMEKEGTDVSNIRAMLGDANMDIDQVMSQVRTTYENSGLNTGGNSDTENNNPGNGNNIDTTSQSQQNQTSTTGSNENGTGSGGSGGPGGSPQGNR